MLPDLGLVMVSKDHATFGSRAVFFRESIRRDAMTGTRIVFVLRSPSRRQDQSLYIKERGNSHRGKELDFCLKVHTR